jgi:hypothetical protein
MFSAFHEGMGYSDTAWAQYLHTHMPQSGIFQFQTFYLSVVSEMGYRLFSEPHIANVIAGLWPLWLFLLIRWASSASAE